MNATHTPGPWVSCPGNARSLYRIECKCTGNALEPIAELRGPDREVNARLIAAAPDLLHALVTALPYIEDATTDPAYKTGAVRADLRMIQEAIAKAER